MEGRDWIHYWNHAIIVVWGENAFDSVLKCILCKYPYNVTTYNYIFKKLHDGMRIVIFDSNQYDAMSLQTFGGAPTLVVDAEKNMDKVQLLLNSSQVYMLNVPFYLGRQARYILKKTHIVERMSELIEGSTTYDKAQIRLALETLFDETLDRDLWPRTCCSCFCIMKSAKDAMPSITKCKHGTCLSCHERSEECYHVSHGKTFTSLVDRQTLQRPCERKKCANMAVFACPDCNSAWYCSSECVTLDLEDHEALCCLMGS